MQVSAWFIDMSRMNICPNDSVYQPIDILPWSYHMIVPSASYDHPGGAVPGCESPMVDVVEHGCLIVAELINASLYNVPVKTFNRGKGSDKGQWVE